MEAEDRFVLDGDGYFEVLPVGPHQIVLGRDYELETLVNYGVVKDAGQL